MKLVSRLKKPFGLYLYTKNTSNDTGTYKLLQQFVKFESAWRARQQYWWLHILWNPPGSPEQKLFVTHFIAERWIQFWRRYYERSNKYLFKDTCEVLSSARRICKRRGWDYKSSHMRDMTKQLRAELNARGLRAQPSTSSSSGQGSLPASPL